MGGAGRLPDLPEAVQGEAEVLLLRRAALRHRPPPLRPHPRGHHQGHRHQVRHCGQLLSALISKISEIDSPTNPLQVRPRARVPRGAAVRLGHARSARGVRDRQEAQDHRTRGRDADGDRGLQ